MSQGGRANRAGKVLESAVEGALKGHGYVEVASDLKKKERLAYLVVDSTNIPKRYARQVHLGKGIYGTDIYVEFYIIGCPSIPSIIIECKWQQVGGSVDEKLPYVNLTIQNCYPAPAVVLIDGGGMKPGAIAWLTQQINFNQNLLAVHTMSSFIVWANNNL
ncbi:PD-(D/E)XK nuclease superfamily protein [Kamptonema sp. UHCC 0994]|uniref:PD-(D/E)XK nuclease superfamily protein n=1 Tax=Kamptonema sp. UHCC 0994 TaxID=3031329 RepID=UPI0023B9311A|nr:PD-(D/E)XK nuclease superfamily protein [Kamptonema sp. UHCC 0994]MDF0552449.1 hypothetical protein [Kamptonema sp. UHCC 0994]